MVAWIVERYLPEATREDVDEAAALLSAATRALAAGGVEIRYLGSTFVAAEEYCISRFESTTADDVRLVCERAGVSYARIVQAQELPAAPLETDRRLG
jgi:NACalpha-BTF3-like transcription factor